jgi:hypothetical protein
MSNNYINGEMNRFSNRRSGRYLAIRDIQKLSEEFDLNLKVNYYHGTPTRAAKRSHGR